MNLKSSEKKDKNEAEFIIEVIPEELEAAINEAYLKNRNRISVPGFRKGKAPRAIIERMYGKEMFLGDAMDALLPEVLRFAMKDTEYKVVGYPKVTDFDVKDDTKSAEITLLVSLYPEITIGEYKGLSAEKPSIDIPDKEIDAEIEKIRTRNARIEKVDRAAKDGDTSIIDFEGFVDGVAFEGGKGENYELELGSGSFIPGFEEKIVGMEIGEERDLDLVFPEQYKEDLAGKPVIFKVKLNELKEKILPDLDDEFAKDVSEFDTLKEYKDDIKANLQKSRMEEVNEVFENELMQQVIESMQGDVPETMIDEKMDVMMDNFNRQMSSYGMQPAQYMQMLGITPEIYKERVRLQAEQQVKATLALEKIAELENIEITDEQIEEEYKEAAELYKMEVEQIKERVPKKDIASDLKLKAAAKIVTDSAKITKSKPKPAKPEAAEKKPTAKKAAPKKSTTAKKEESSENN
ncbi:MAG: trigger factor [Oscillospiraceae bacterium]|nr:trigger factor [Oscillospiraceae bacterium]